MRSSCVIGSSAPKPRCSLPRSARPMGLPVSKTSFRRTNSTSSRVPSPTQRVLTSKQSTVGLLTSSAPGPVPARAEQAVNATAQIAPRRKRLLPTFPVSSREKSGKRDVPEIADIVEVRRASNSDATTARAPNQAPGVAPPAFEGALTALTAINVGDWRALSQRAIESNGYYLPDWELAVNATAPGRTGASAISVRRGDRLIGLMPVVSLSRAMQIPLPALVSAH